MCTGLAVPANVEVEVTVGQGEKGMGSRTSECRQQQDCRQLYSLSVVGKDIDVGDSKVLDKLHEVISLGKRLLRLDIV